MEESDFIIEELVCLMYIKLKPKEYSFLWIFQRVIYLFREFNNKLVDQSL